MAGPALSSSVDAARHRRAIHGGWIRGVRSLAEVPTK